MARGDLLDMTTESFDRCMAVNLRGAFFLVQECARRMLVTPADTYGPSMS
jgi:NAD(P)-dependent dehydrogenase (short-subunit alcohol dehydrogenase family)